MRQDQSRTTWTVRSHREAIIHSKSACVEPKKASFASFAPSNETAKPWAPKSVVAADDTIR